MTLETTAYGERRTELLVRPGLSGPDRRRALADLTDAWLAGLFDDAGGTGSGAALVAVGGYGRRELSPGSDLDVVLLRPTGVGDKRAAELADQIWYPIWDSGVRLDHAVRTPAEARRVAADDVRALLGMLDVRHVAGDVALSEGLRSSILSDWRGLATKRLPDLLAAAQDRAERSGDVAFALEPDLKESRGGLRDLTVLRAIAASWVADTPHSGLEDAQRTLLDVRDALHTVTGRSTDRLVLQEQDAVAQPSGCWTPTRSCSGSVAPVVRSPTPPTSPGTASSEPSSPGVGRSRFLTGPRRISRDSAPCPARRRRGGAGGRGRPRARRTAVRGRRARAARCCRGGPERAAALTSRGRPPGHGVPADRRAVARRRPRRPGLAAGRGLGRDPGLGGPRPGRTGRPSDARLGTGTQPAAAQPRPPLHRRPSPRGGRGRGRRPSPAGSTDRTCCSSVLSCTTSARAGPGTTPRPGSRSWPTSRRASGSTSATPRRW